MPANIVYALTGSGVSVKYETGSASVELILDDSYGPFEGTHNVAGGDLTEASTDMGTQVTGALHGEVAGRGGPIEKTQLFTLFLPETPPLSDSAEESDATGAAVFADPDPRGTLAPEYRTATLTGTVSLPAQGPKPAHGSGGRF